MNSKTQLPSITISKSVIFIFMHFLKDTIFLP